MVPVQDYRRSLAQQDDFVEFLLDGQDFSLLDLARPRQPLEMSSAPGDGLFLSVLVIARPAAASSACEDEMRRRLRSSHAGSQS